jgi:DNA-directed RNA polymerase specialized sigma24 family protein
MNTDFDWEQLLKTDRPEDVLQRFWNKYDSEIGCFLESLLTKSMHKADADYDDVTQEVKICLFNALKGKKYNPEKSNFKSFASMLLSRKRVDFIRKKVRNQNKLNKLFNSSKTRNGDEFSVQENSMFNEYLDKWQILRNQLPESTKVILAEIGQYSPKDIMRNHRLTDVQYCRLLKSVRTIIEDTIFSHSKF